MLNINPILIKAHCQMGIGKKNNSISDSDSGYMDEESETEFGPFSTDIELNAERLSWSSNNAAGAFASPLKLPMAGFRQFNSGLNLTQGFYGEYWSSNTDGFISAYALDFIVNAASVSSNGGRGNGFSVRCIKD